MEETGKPRRIRRPDGLKTRSSQTGDKPSRASAGSGSGKPAVRTQRTRIAPPSEPKRHDKSLEGLGHLLKTKREIHGLTRRDIVVKIKIPLEQLESIEDGRLSSLPPVFAKGFLRAYANELGLDAEAILEDYRQMTGGFKNEPASREPLASRYVETSVGPGRWRPGARTVVIAVLVVVALAVGIWLWPSLKGALSSAMPFTDKNAAPVTADNGSTEPGQTPSVPVFSTEPPAPAPAGERDNELAALSEAAARLTSGGFSFDTFADDGGAGQFVEDPLSTPPTPAATGSLADAGAVLGVPAISEGGTLTLASQQDKVWVQVEVDGRQPQFLVLKTGEKATWTANESIVVTAGQATALNVNWNGQDLGPLGGNDRPIVEARFPRQG